MTHYIEHDDLLNALKERGGLPVGSFELFMLAYEAELRSIHHSMDDLSCLSVLPNLIPFPHQIETAKRVIHELHGRALLADEVGLGKTIEAGLILKEYMVRGLVQKALILVPASLVLQWTRELNEKFGVRAFAQRNEWSWTSYDVLVASLDTTKRDPHRTAVLSQPYDLLIVDEAHKLKNSRTRNWQLINEIQKKYLLLVTATPVQNDMKELYNLINLLRPGQLGNPKDFTKEHVSTKRSPKNPVALRHALSDVMVRNRRVESAVDFTERHAKTVPLELSIEERELYNAVTSFVREEFLRRKESKRSVLALITLQREICSSSYAAMGTLEGMLKRGRLTPSEAVRVQELYHLAEAVPGYTKISKVIELIQAINDKVIVFTEYRATQDFLLYMLQQSGIKAVLFRGGYKRGKKDWMKDLFERRAQVLIATEAGGEGINLQFCNQVINYDLPWNPMRVEQRIGRVHRVGQTRPVYIQNFSTKGTIEEHIVRMLQDKIQMFEQVIGELDVILGPRAFEEDVLEALLESRDETEIQVRLNVLSKRVKRTNLSNQQGTAT
ncbi:DEAD/DEAH box helicase [Ferroacidibacillus organovorans]|uniref:ATP-dependent helicase n=1 Tax=Ferroacidibacillus organovorans TaxID=1765683 RepID=A0A117SYD1_9BACL|nr:SNF2-related protein [Ferroacidibacillus organovorans]KUO96768.1 ATP-dependent helicase [Ferroacidibacillus organovorans]